MWRIRGRLRRSTLVTALVALGVLAVAGSAVATTVAMRSVDDVIKAKATKKTTLVRVDTEVITTSGVFHDIPGSLATITFAKPSILLVTLTGESACYAGGGYCVVRIVVDGVGELGPGKSFAKDFAFDSSDGGTESQFSWEGHAMQRSSDVLPPGSYTVRSQLAVLEPATFRLDDVHVTVEAVLA